MLGERKSESEIEQTHPRSILLFRDEEMKVKVERVRDVEFGLPRFSFH